MTTDKSLITDPVMLHKAKAIILAHAKEHLKVTSKTAFERLQIVRINPDRRIAEKRESALKEIIQLNQFNILRVERLLKKSISYIPEEMRYWPSFN